MEFPKTQKVKAKIVEKNQLNEKVVEVVFELIAPEKLEFLPGQFISLNVGEGKYRSYSISSSSYDNGHVAALISAGHDGLGANFIKKSKLGDEAEFIGPSGRFVLPEKLEANLIFVVTGTGITPILSMLDFLLRENAKNKIRLYFGARNNSELFKTDVLDVYCEKFDDFDYVVCFSKETDPNVFKTNPRAEKGRVTEILEKQAESETDYFICGHPQMVVDMVEMLEENGVNKSNIHKEKFTWAKSK